MVLDGRSHRRGATVQCGLYGDITRRRVMRCGGRSVVFLGGRRMRRRRRRPESLAKGYTPRHNTTPGSATSDRLDSVGHACHRERDRAKGIVSGAALFFDADRKQQTLYDPSRPVRVSPLRDIRAGRITCSVTPLCAI